MSASNSIQDTLAITHAIHEVARAFDEKLHLELLPQMFTDAAITSPEYRGVKRMVRRVCRCQWDALGSHA